MSRIRAYQNLNGRFKIPNSGCGCEPKAVQVLTKPKTLFTDRIVSNDSRLMTNKVMSLNGILEDVLGYGEGSAITTVGIKIDMASTINLGLGIAGGLLGGALLKNVFKIK